MKIKRENLIKGTTISDVNPGIVFRLAGSNDIFIKIQVNGKFESGWEPNCVNLDNGVLWSFDQDTLTHPIFTAALTIEL